MLGEAEMVWVTWWPKARENDRYSTTDSLCRVSAEGGRTHSITHFGAIESSLG